MAKDLVQLLISSNTKDAVSGIKNAKNETKGLNNELRATRTELTLTLSVLKNIGKILMKVTNYSDNYKTSLNLLKTSLGDTTAQATKFIDTLSEMSGIDEGTLTNQVAKFTQLGESLNLSNEYAEKFSENLSVLTTKLAMLYNVDYSVMASNVQKAIQGTQTTLKATTGIEATSMGEQAVLNAYGIDRQVSSLNDAELAIVRYATILRQVSNDNNVYQNTVNSLAWQKQILTAQVKRLATAVGGLLTPAFTQLVTVANAVLMVITEIVGMLAALVGATIEMDNGVNEAATGYDNLATSIGGASAAAKKSLRGFDKLNNITTPSKGGGGGGSLGIDSSILGLLGNVSDGFLDIKNKATEIRDSIMDWLGFSKLVDENGKLIGWKYEGIEKTLENIIKSWSKLNTVGKVFVALGIYAVITKIISGFKNLLKLIGNTGLIKALTSLQSKFITTMKVTQNGITTVQSFATAMDRVKMGIIGAAGIVVGFGMMYDAMKSIKEEGPNVINVIEGIAAALLIVGGTVGVLEAIVGVFNPWMVAIGAVVAGISALVTWLGIQDNTVVESTSILSEYKQALSEVKEEQQDSILTLESKVGRIKTLEDELNNLVDSNGKVTGSEEEVGSKLSALNDLMGTEYEITNGQITLNGKLIKGTNELRQSIDRYCESLRVEGYLEIKRKEYNTRLEQQLKLEEEINEKTKVLENSQKSLNDTSTEGVLKWITDNQSRLNELASLQSTYKSNEAELKAYEEAGYLASVGRYDDAQKLLTETVSQVGVTTEDVIRQITQSTGTLSSEVQKSVENITNQSPTMTVKVQLDTTKASQQYNNLRSTMAQSAVNLPNVSFHADGGFVNEGEMFVAREAGPELVGTINGHTAVANNDQIVKGIQSGVFSAMMSALGTQDFGGTTVIKAEGDTEGLLNFISFKQEQKNRQFN